MKRCVLASLMLVVGAALLPTSAAAQGACFTRDECGLVAPAEGVPMHWSEEFRVNLDVADQQFLFLTELGEGQEGARTTPIEVDDARGVFQLPTAIPPGDYNVYASFVGCPSCITECAEFRIHNDELPEAIVPAPVITGAAEIDPWNDPVCGLFDDRFRTNVPPRMVRVRFEHPDDDRLRPMARVRIPRPDLGVDQSVTFGTSVLYWDERGEDTGIAIPLGVHDDARAVDIEVWFVDAYGRPGPSSTVHTTLGAEALACQDGQCAVVGPPSPFIFGCAEPGGGEPPPTRDVPVEGGVAAAILLASFRRLPRRHELNEQQSDC